MKKYIKNSGAAGIFLILFLWVTAAAFAQSDTPPEINVTDAAEASAIEAAAHNLMDYDKAVSDCTSGYDSKTAECRCQNKKAYDLLNNNFQNLLTKYPAMKGSIVHFKPEGMDRGVTMNAAHLEITIKGLAPSSCP